MNESFYKDLDLIRKDQYQWQAYKSDGNTVVTAGPGSGKTRILTLKAIKIIQSLSSSTSGLACISYSRETVRELKKRLTNYGYQKRSQDYIGTVHGFCIADIITPFSRLYPEYEIPTPFRIASTQLTEKIYNGILYDIKMSSNQLPKAAIERERLIAIVGASQVNITSDPLARTAAGVFESRLVDSNSFDFTQIVKVATKMIQEKEYVQKTLESKYPWILIDEYQDLGKALHEMVFTLFGQTVIKVFSVGDIDQSIYGFQGAYPEFLEELNQLDDFESVRLKYNYRSHQDIINASIKALNPPPPERKYEAIKVGEKSAEFSFVICKEEMQDQYTIVCEKIIPELLRKGIPLNEIVIVTGKNSEASELCNCLREHSIDCYIANWSFDNRSDSFQWLLECCRWSVGSYEVSFEQLFKFWEYLIELHNNNRMFWDRIKQKMEFHEVLTVAKRETSLRKWLSVLFDGLSLIDLFKNSARYPDEQNNLIELLKEAEKGKVKDFTVKKFSILDTPEKEVTVVTRHSVKGLEFEAVVMLGMEEGRFPFYKHTEGSKELQEEHRLCYVCVSRAKQKCILIYSKKHTFISQFGAFERNFTSSRFYKALYSIYGNSKNTFDFS